MVDAVVVEKSDSDWREWLRLLDAPPDTVLSVGLQKPGGGFAARRVPVSDLAAIEPPGDACFWVGLISLPLGGGRGTAAEALDVLGIWADLDAEPGKCGDLPTCGMVLTDLEGLLGRRASWVVRSGHGLQPVWRMAGDVPVERQVALLYRWGLLVKRVAEQHGGKADGVFDAARVLRAPGGVNWKSEPVPVGFAPGAPGRLQWSELAAVLDREGVPEAREGPVDDVGLQSEWLTPGEPCRAVRAALDRAATALQGERHPTMLAASTGLARLGEQGHRGVAAGMEELRGLFVAAATRPGNGQRSEAAATREWRTAVHGIRLAEPTPEEERGCCPEVPDARLLEAVEGLWTATPELAHIKQAADSGTPLSPVGLLGAVLARVSFLTDHLCELPGSPNRGSLNYFVGLVGGPGAGKSSLIYRAELLLPSPELPCRCGDHADFSTIPQGSGEGLVHSYFEPVVVGRRSVLKKDRTQLLVLIDEIEALLQIGARSSATIGPVLRSMWSGVAAGFSNASSERRVMLPAGSYRLALIAGVQPERAAALFGEGTGGTPQRFVWFPCDGEAAGVWDLSTDGEPPAWPGVLPAVATRSKESWKPQQVTVDPELLAEMRVHANEVRKGRTELGELDQHRAFLRLRTAALLALLHREHRVTRRWWDLAELVMVVSDGTRDGMLKRMAVAAAEAVKQQGALTAMREEAARDHREEKIERLAERIGRLVESRGRQSRRELSIWAGRERKYLDDALALAVEQGTVTAVDGGWQ